MKNFFDTEGKKITEKAFTHSLVISVISILMCLVALCSMTYAWFSADVSSASNRLESGQFDLKVAVRFHGDANNPAADVDGMIDEKGQWVFNFETVGTYTVTLKMTDEASVKGYCAIKIGDTEYHTGVIIGADLVNEDYPNVTDPLTFTIETVEANTTVKLDPRWGVPVESTVFENTHVKVGTTEVQHETE